MTETETEACSLRIAIAGEKDLSIQVEQASKSIFVAILGSGREAIAGLGEFVFAATTLATLERRGSARTSFSTNHHNNNNVLPIPHFKVRRRLYFHSIEHANITHAGASQSQTQANPRQKTELSTPFSPSQWVSQPPLFESTGKRKRKARVSRRVRRV